MYYVELWFYWYNFEPVVLDTAKTVSGGGSNISRNAAMSPVNFFICVYIYFFDEIFSFKIQIEVCGLDVHISVLFSYSVFI